MCLRNKCPGFIYFLAPGVCRKAGWQEFIRRGAGGPSPQVPAKHGDRSQLHPHQTSVLSFNWSHQRQSTWLDSCWCMFQGTNKRRGFGCCVMTTEPGGRPGGCWCGLKRGHTTPCCHPSCCPTLRAPGDLFFFSPR